MCEKIAGQIQTDNEMVGEVNFSINNNENRDNLTNKKLDYLHFTEKEILLIIKTLRKGASPGSDSISTNRYINTNSRLFHQTTYLYF